MQGDFRGCRGGLAGADVLIGPPEDFGLRAATWGGPYGTFDPLYAERDDPAHQASL